MEALLVKIDAAISARSDMRPQYPQEHIGSSELRYSKFGWQAYAKVVPGRKRRGSEIFGSPCLTAEEAADSLISALNHWGEALK